MKSPMNIFRALLISICLAFFLAVPAAVGAQEKKAVKDEQNQKKQSKAEQEAAKKQEKREARYEKILAFAKQKYDVDPEFKAIVDDKYRSVRRDHTLHAYSVNMRPSDALLVNKENEKLVFDNALYNNPLAQDFVNRLGQSLVPAGSNRLYTFKILQNPIPEARALSTGTIYISTGYLSLIDNEAQLAYILGHEIAHVESDHWFEDALVDAGTVPYMDKKTWVGIIRVVSALSGGSQQLVSATLVKLYGFNDAFSWENFQEDEADAAAMKYMLARNYDVREVEKLYLRMRTVASDPRSQTGFIADPDRIKNRLDNYGSIWRTYATNGAVAGASTTVAAVVKDRTNNGGSLRGIAKVMNEELTPEVKKKLDEGEMIASTAEFQSTMALVKRDNGVRAFQFDLFEMARANLSDSISIRSNDPVAYYYYGKVLKQTARNPSEMSKALSNLTQAIVMDKRQTIAEPYLFRAMLRLADRNPTEAPLIFDDLKTYVEIYQRESGGLLPPNMEFVYDFMQDLGVADYRITPTINTAQAQQSTLGTRPTTTSSVAETNPTNDGRVVVTNTVTNPVVTPAKSVTKKPKKP